MQDGPCFCEKAFKMLGLSVLAMASMLTLNSPAQDAGAAACGAGVAAPLFRVTVSEDPIRFNTDKTRRELASFNIDTVSPFPEDLHPEVGGLTHGGITLNQTLKFTKNVDPVTHAGCIALHKVNINLHINPTIYIANDMPNEECWFKEIFQHERRHVETDRALTAKYQQRFQDALNMIFLTPADYTAGPMPENAMQDADKRMNESVAAALQAVFGQMQLERAAAQAQIDTLQEYQRLNNACAVHQSF
jgi:hypothetical protein